MDLMTCSPSNGLGYLTLIAVLLNTVFFQFAGRAAEPAKAPAHPPSAGLANDWLREQSSAFSAWDFGVQLRARYEIKENAGSFPNRDFIGDGQDNDNSYLLLREKVHVGYKPVPWLAGYVEGRDSSTTGDDRNPNIEADRFDLHQAYLLLGDAKRFPLTLKMGRQQMQYGDERFIGVSDWSNVERVFDAAKLRFENETLWVDAFAARPIIPRDGYFNVVNDYDWFSGVYASSRKLLPRHETDAYFLAHNVGVSSPNAIASGLGGATARDIYTIGARVKSMPGQFKGWDYSGELAGQFGSLNSGGVRLEHEALAGDVTAGYSWKDGFGSPRVGLGYTYASGDSNPTDRKNETFDLLFGTNHKPYGVMDLWGLRNIHSPRLAASLKPLQKLSLSGEYYLLWLADVNDSFFPEIQQFCRSRTGPGRQLPAHLLPGFSTGIRPFLCRRLYQAVGQQRRRQWRRRGCGLVLRADAIQFLTRTPRPFFNLFRHAHSDRSRILAISGSVLI
jgi:hypothetical protein